MNAMDHIDSCDPIEVASGRQLDALAELASLGPRWHVVFPTTQPESDAEYRERIKYLIRRASPKTAIGLAP